MKRLFLLFSCICFIAGGCQKSTSDSESQSNTDQLSDAELDVRVLTENLFHPWELVWGPDNKIWMTERNGRVSQVDPASGQVTNLISINDVDDVGEGGLLGLALNPNFSTTLEGFVVYNYNKNGNYTEKVVRYTYNGTT